ncbi:hypothetical protein ACWCSD_36000, partial [Nonomuraea sp. NPDC001684]
MRNSHAPQRPVSRSDGRAAGAPLLDQPGLFGASPQGAVERAEPERLGVVHALSGQNQPLHGDPPEVV